VTTVHVHFPDDQATALAAKAAAQGMTLEAWLQKLAEEALPEQHGNMDVEEPMQAAREARPKRISQVIAEIMSDVPAEELAKLPRDGASQIDHYVYGLPKRYE
jgi:hypothetical protein